MLGGASNRNSRSTDYGETWSHDGINGFETFLWGDNPDTHGAILANRTFFLYRSDDLGETYTQLGAFGGWTNDIAEVPASASLPSGRILAALDNGLTYSSDGGLTFQPSNVYQQGALRGWSVTFAPEAGHPYGGAAYAAVSVPALTLYRSDDGGATWNAVFEVNRGDYGLASIDKARVKGAPDGALWVGVVDDIPGPSPSVGVMLVSRDGGQTFAEQAEGWGGYSPNGIEIAPDGRVYVATDSLVWRTKESVVVRADEPPEASGAVLRVEPNPVAGAAQIRLTLASPEADVRMAIFDARGREVWSASGARGSRVWEVDTSAWAVGVYVVRAEVGGEVVTAQVTVVR